MTDGIPHLSAAYAESMTCLNSVDTERCSLKLIQLPLGRDSAAWKLNEGRAWVSIGHLCIGLSYV